jgi:hypothetical protein
MPKTNGTIYSLFRFPVHYVGRRQVSLEERHHDLHRFLDIAEKPFVTIA